MAEGSVARNIQLALLVSAYPSLLQARHLKALGRLADGVSVGEDASSVRARNFSAALGASLEAGQKSPPTQACAAVLAQVEVLLSDAEHAHKHCGKTSVPHVSEIDALRPLLDFINFVGASHGALDSDLAWEVLSLGPGLATVKELAERALTTRRVVQPRPALGEEGESPEEARSDRNAVAVVLNAALRLVAANLALSIHIDDALEVEPVQNLKRVCGLLHAMVHSAADCDFLAPLAEEDRAEMRELALVAIDLGGEAFFKDPLVMVEAANGVLHGVARGLAAGSDGDSALDIAVLKILARPSVLLPLLLSEAEDVRRGMVDIVEAGAGMQFPTQGEEAEQPGQEAQSSNFQPVPADWNMGLCHRESIQLSKDDRRVYKSSSRPDYSCAMSSEAFSEGVHSWEITFESTGSTWVGIAGESTKDHLGSSPVIEYGATLYNKGEWKLYGPLTATKMEPASFGSGTKVSMVLDFDWGTFDMYVDGGHKLSVQNLEPGRPLHAYVCMDNSGESSELTSATQQLVSAHCRTLSDAVRLVGNAVIRIETGILASPVAQQRSESYAARILASFCSRLEGLASDMASGTVKAEMAVRAVSLDSLQLSFENVTALACQFCSSPVLAGNFAPLSRFVSAVHGLIAGLGLGEDHWMPQCLQAFVSVLGPALASVIWGEVKPGASEDEGRVDWLSLPLFSRRLLASPPHLDLLIAEGEPSIFDSMLQPRVAVLNSPYLDRLERDVIIACLYHIGMIEHVLAMSESSEETVATCQVSGSVHALRIETDDGLPLRRMRPWSLVRFAGTSWRFATSRIRASKRTRNRRTGTILWSRSLRNAGCFCRLSLSAQRTSRRCPRASEGLSRQLSSLSSGAARHRRLPASGTRS